VLGVRVDRTRCIGAGNCIHIAPTAFDWVPGDHAKIAVVDLDSVEEELVREAVLACPTQAITIEVTTELLPWQLRQRTQATRRVVKTFMFTDIVGSTGAGRRRVAGLAAMARRDAARALRRIRG
jgi:ferredoxin